MKDALVVIGSAGIVGGCWWHYPPLALFVGGALLLGVGVAVHFRNLGAGK